MGFTTGSYQQTVYTITGDGNGGFWWASKDSKNVVYQIGYEGGTATISAAAQLYGRTTFKQLITAFVQFNLSLPTTDVQINVENLQEQNNLLSQFQDPALTDADLQAIANFFNVEEFCKRFGVFLLVRRFFLLGLMTLVQLRDVLIYMGQQGKIGKPKAEQVLDFLLNNGTITKAQYDAFFVSWDKQVKT